MIAVATPTEGRAVIASAAGAIYSTGDGGQSFQRARVPALSGLSAIAMADEQSGWAVGPGVVLRSEDGGALWERQRLPGRAADHLLVAVAAVDRLRACALDDRGQLIETVDGGAVWRARGGRLRNAKPDPVSESPGIGSRRGGLTCLAGERPLCHWVDPGGRSEVGRFVLGGEALPPISLAPAAEGDVIDFRTGGFEPGSEALASWLGAAERLRGEPVEWTIDVRVSPEEVDAASMDRDPGRLFDLIEGRGEELLRRLEEAGVPSDRISLTTLPPWGFEDHLDDDPGFLERYWTAHVASTPQATIAARWDVPLERIAVDPLDGAVLVSTREGRLFRGRGASSRLALERLPTAESPRALARLGAIWVAVGPQGSLWESASRVGSARSRQMDGGAIEPDGAPVGASSDGWEAASLIEGAPFFEALRAVSVTPSGREALAVGDGGRLAWRASGASGWRVVAPLAQEGRPGIR